MRIQITSSIIGDEGTPWERGTVRDVSEQFALQLIAENRAVAVVEEVPPSPDAVESRDPALTTASAPAITKRGKR